MRQWQGIGGQISTIKDLELRSALKRLDDHAADISAAVTLLNQNKSAEPAQVVVARAYVPQADSQVVGDEVVKAYSVDLQNAVGSQVDDFSTKPTPGTLVAHAFVKERANSGGGTAFTVTVGYGFDGAPTTINVIDTLINPGEVLTGTIPFYSDGSSPIGWSVTTTGGLEYDLHLNIVAV